jgi:hypothetical protein
MTDGVTPRCVYCGETVELVDHIERLNAHQTTGFRTDSEKDGQ